MRGKDQGIPQPKYVRINGTPKKGYNNAPLFIIIPKGINEPSAPIDPIKFGKIPIDHEKSLSLF
jgi:hypothetical protein